MRPSALLLAASVAFAIGVPILQSLGGWGLSAAEFSRSGDATLRAAGYAFSIWGLIYAGLVIYAASQLWRGGTEAGRRLEVPAALAALACGAWLLASGADYRWATVAIITAGAGVLIAGLLRLGPTQANLRERLLALWPLALLAGWLTAACALNWLTVLTAEGIIAPGSTPAALAGLAAVALVAGLTTWRIRLVPYPAAVLWALAAVWVAERSRNDAVAAAALIAAAALAGVTALALVRRPSAGGA